MFTQSFEERWDDHWDGHIMYHLIVKVVWSILVGLKFYKQKLNSNVEEFSYLYLLLSSYQVRVFLEL